uniref:Immunoglobulin V-set domain-containing protein n=1 Tax=Phasianus colchicus TaxID=9054 RepID=A0A669PTB0_PHACC
MDVLQVTWQKINGSSFQNIATYSQAHGLRLIGSFRRKARFIRAALNTSAITLQNLTFEDVSCYRCIFNVFPCGSFSSKDICLNIQKSGNTDKPEVKMLDLLSPNVTGIQKRISLVVVFIGAVLAVLVLLIMGLINRKRRRLQKQRAHSTPEKEKGLQQDVSEQSKSLNMLEDQDSAYQNKRQTPGSSLHKKPLNLRRNLEENKGRETWKRNKRLVFSEEADSQDSAIPNMELTELCNNDLGCTLMKNNSETEACEESELHPAMATPWPSSGEQSAHQRLSPQVQRSTKGFTQVGNPG